MLHEPPYWDIKELSEYLHIKRSTLYAWAAQGKIPSLKIHGLLRFRQEAIDQWVASFEQAPSPRPSPLIRHSPCHELDPLIAAAKREVYTPRRGKTRPKSRPIRKEETDGAV
jgi:excisionase family DNA binding protein